VGLTSPWSPSLMLGTFVGGPTGPLMPSLPLPVPPTPGGAAASPTAGLPLTVDQVLYPYVWVFFGAFIVALAFTPVMRQVAIYWDIVDRPDNLRKAHREPVAYLGGIAVFAGFFVGLAISQLVQWHYWLPNNLNMPANIVVPWPLWVGAIGVVLLGLADDVFGVRPRWKLLGQVLAAAALLYAGVGTSLTGPFVEAAVERIAPRMGVTVAPEIVAWSTWVSSCWLTTAIVVFCCNAANLMDGLDGLCGGVTAIIALGLLALAVYVARFPDVLSPSLATQARSLNLDALRVVVGLSLLGATLGFVPFNFNPASIFMGDAGSLFLGFACAVMIVLLGEREAKWLLAAGVMFSLPVLDTALAIARRKLAGRPLFSADKQHFHHQLVARGLSVKQAVLCAYGLALFFVLCGMSIVFMRTRYAVGFYLVLFGYIIVAAYKIGMVHERVGPGVAAELSAGRLTAEEPEPPAPAARPPLNGNGEGSNGPA